MRKIFTILLMMFVFSGFLNAKTYYSIANGYWTNSDGSGGSGTVVWSETPGGIAVSANTHPKKGDIIYLEGHNISLDYDLTAQNGIELHVDINSRLTYTGTEGILIKTGGELNIYGYVEIQSLDLKNGTSVNIFSAGTLITNDFVYNNAVITVDGDVQIGGEFENAASGVVNGGGSITAASYTGTGTIFGIVANTIAAGSSVGGATWDGSIDSDWNTAANWVNNTVPDNTYNVVITTDGESSIITGSRNAKSITINSGAILTIAPNADLTVAEKITNNAGESGLVIQSTSSGDGSLIYSSGTPVATVNRYCSASLWHFVSPSTTGVTAQEFFDSGNEAWLVWFSEPDGSHGGDPGEGWNYITTLTDPINVGKGYSYGPSANETIDFTGSLQTGDFPATISWTDTDHGYNLIGNPFSSAVQWNGNSDWNLSNMEATIWIWVPTTTTAGNYVSYTTGATYDIPVGQGFFVHALASSPTLTLPASQRLHSSNTFYKNVSENNGGYENYVTVVAENNQNSDRIQISFDENGTDEFDNGWDGTKMFGSPEAPQLYLVEQDKKLSYNHLPLLTEDEERTVAMNYMAGVDGVQQLIFDLTNLHELHIHIEDLQTGITQYLNQNPTYTFNGYQNDNADRFLLHFTWSPGGIGEDNEESSNIQIYSYGKDVYIRSTDNTINQNGDVFVYDLMGREILQQHIHSDELIKIPINLSNTYVVVKVVKEGSIKTQKVYIK